MTASMLAAASAALGLNWLAALLFVTSLVIGAILVVQSNWKSLVGWALVALGAGLLIEFCTTWARTIHG